MKGWLKDHILELASLVVAVVGVKWLIDFWSRLCEMSSSYPAEALLACGLAAAAAAIAATFLARSGYRSELAAKDAEIADRDARIAELEERPTQKDVDDLKRSHAEEIAAMDAEIERLCSPVEAVRRVISGLPVNELAMVGTLRNGPLKTSGFVEILSHLASLGIAEKLRTTGVFTPTWGLTQQAVSALGEDKHLSKSAADAAADGVRDLEAERRISSIISKLPEEQLGAVFVMYEQGSFDYRAVDSNPWGYERDQGADDLRELESAGIAEYRTLGNGKRRWTLTERATRVIGDDPTLIDEGRRYFESVVGEDES